MIRIEAERIALELIASASLGWHYAAKLCVDNKWAVFPYYC